MQGYTITIIKRDGGRDLLRDHAGVMTFISRDHADRMTWRLTAADTQGDLYEVNEPTK